MADDPIINLDELDPVNEPALLAPLVYVPFNVSVFPLICKIDFKKD